MKRLILVLVVSLAFLPLLNTPAFGRTLRNPGPVVSSDRGLNIDLWTDRAQDEIYDVGDSQEIYFRSNDDCYATIYHIDTDGHVEVLFPRYPDDGFIFGGMTYRLPDYYDAWDLRARGPEGIGYLHAVASRTPRAFRYAVHQNHYHLDVDPIMGDPYLAINTINAGLIPRRHLHAAATVSFFVGRHSWYPRYMCYDCHGRSMRYHPYRDACPRYNVRLTRNYDYWWGYDYHPAFVHLSFGGPFWRFELRTVPVHRHKRYRYLNYAYGYGNYHPIRPLSRSPRVVRYKSPKVKTRRSYARNYKPVSYRDTRIRRTGNTRTPVRPRTTTTTRTTRTTTRSARVPGTATRDRSTTGSGTTRSSSVGSTRSRSTNGSGTTRSSSVGSTTSSRNLSAPGSRSSSVSRSSAAPADGTSQRSVTNRRTTSTRSTRTSTAPSSSSRSARKAVSSASRTTPRKSTRSTPSSSSSPRGRTLSSERSSRDERSTRNSRSSGSSSRATRSSSRSSRKDR
ncbi:MAG: hypothetical protein C0600_14640 [Ignavibacteria bacterium]|nr:MAG: hypothetical protein C0600_14640 [Ignavibacteria bacterium]